jgi:hypothetical protein
MTNIEAMTELEKVARKLRAEHTPDPDDSSDIGWIKNPDGSGGGYGRIDPACPTCDHPGEYAVAWPCRVYTLLDDALKALDQ